MDDNAQPSFGDGQDSEYRSPPAYSLGDTSSEDELEMDDNSLPQCADSDIDPPQPAAAAARSAGAAASAGTRKRDDEADGEADGTSSDAAASAAMGLGVRGGRGRMRTQNGSRPLVGMFFTASGKTITDASGKQPSQLKAEGAAVWAKLAEQFGELDCTNHVTAQISNWATSESMEMEGQQAGVKRYQAIAPTEPAAEAEEDGEPPEE